MLPTVLAEVSLAPADSTERLAPGHRPFEVFLARQMEAEEVETQWFARHGREPVTEFPARYSGGQHDRLAARLALIESDDPIRLLEQPQFKRRWHVADFAAETKEACEGWLLDRLEDLFAPGGPLSLSRPRTLEEVSAALRRDPRVPAVLEILAGTAAFDLEGTAGRLLAENGLHDNPYRLYTDEGIRKLRRWQWVWEKQELEDRTPAGSPPPSFVDPETGETTDSIPVPPKFDKGDYRKAAWFQLRGKLNVPRERFVLFADVDPPCWLWESLPDLRRWGTAEAHEEQRAMAEYLCARRSCPCEIVDAWRAMLDAGGKRRPLRAAAQASAPQMDLIAEQQEAFRTGSLEQKVAVLKALGEGGETGFALSELKAKVYLSGEALRAALSALVAEGTVLEKGKRPKRWVVANLQKQLL